MLGPGWWHVSKDIRQALVLERVLLLVLSQDESIRPETVLKTAHALTEEVRRLLEQETGDFPSTR